MTEGQRPSDSQSDGRSSATFWGFVRESPTPPTQPLHMLWSPLEQPAEPSAEQHSAEQHSAEPEQPQEEACANGSPLEPLEPPEPPEPPELDMAGMSGKLDELDSGACWEWQGAIDIGGYGKYSVGGRRVMAHRFAWSLVNGPIPAGMVIWHACGNFRCVRPDHLELLTRGEQRLRSKLAITPERFWALVEKLPDPPLSDDAAASKARERIASDMDTDTGTEGVAEGDAVGGCWLWQGRVTPQGYGEFVLRGKHVVAHRYAYILAHGSIPDDLQLVHRCGVPRCVRPAHLALADRKAISRHIWQAVTHCLHGHPRIPENLHTTPKGKQLCRLCHNDRIRRYATKRREEQRAAERRAAANAPADDTTLRAEEPRSRCLPQS